jgi:hypothetical protein
LSLSKLHVEKTKKEQNKYFHQLDTINISTLLLAALSSSFFLEVEIKAVSFQILYKIIFLDKFHLKLKNITALAL